MRGDTIVEVMIVLAILGLSFSVSYATANKGLNQSRNAQEHSEALNILNSQIDQLHTAIGSGFDPAVLPYTNHSFCFTDPANNTASFAYHRAASDTVPVLLSSDTLSYYLAACQKNTFYRISATYLAAPPGGGQPTVIFRARWQGSGGLPKQQEEITYRMKKITVAPRGFMEGEVPASGVASVSSDVLGGYAPSGTTVHLSWSSSNVTSCAMTGLNGVSLGPIGLSGTNAISTTLTADTTYKLTCNGPNGAATASTSVSVAAAVNINSFTASIPGSNSDKINKINNNYYKLSKVGADQVTLSWSIQNPSNCTITNETGANISTVTTTSGSIYVGNNGLDHTYKLSCQDHYGTKTENIKLGPPQSYIAAYYCNANGCGYFTGHKELPTSFLNIGWNSPNIDNSRCKLHTWNNAAWPYNIDNTEDAPASLSKAEVYYDTEILTFQLLCTDDWGNAVNSGWLEITPGT